MEFITYSSLSFNILDSSTYFLNYVTRIIQLWNFGRGVGARWIESHGWGGVGLIPGCAPHPWDAINRVPTPHHRFARSHADANIGNAPESSQHYSRLLYCYNCRYDATIQDCSPPAAAHQVWSGCGLCRRRRHSPHPLQTPRELP